MPLVRSIAVLADGWAIATSDGVSHAFTSAQLTAAQKSGTLAAGGTTVAAALQAQMQSQNDFVNMHLTSLVPLQGTLIVSTGAALTGSWWL